jgi:hypothetical protein
MTSFPAGPERKRVQEFIEQQTAAKSGDEEKTAAVAAGLGAGQVDRGKALNIAVQHIAAGEVEKLRKRVQTISFCQAVRELSEVIKSNILSAAQIGKDTAKARQRLNQLSEIYLQRISQDYPGAAAIVGAEALPAGSMPTLAQAEGLVERLTRGAVDDRATPLMWAVERGSAATVEKLLELGVDVNARDRLGMTALTMAVEGEQEAIVRLLLKAPDIDPNIKTNLDETALEIAEEWNYQTIADLLREAGDDIKAHRPREQEKPGGSAADGSCCAQSGGFENVVRSGEWIGGRCAPGSSSEPDCTACGRW